MHVLVIPSWYPQFDGDPGGSFFREQAIALSKRLNKVGVLFPNQRSLRELINPAAVPSGVISVQDQGTCLVQRQGYNWTPRINYGIAQQWILHGLPLFKRYVALHGMPDVLHAHSALYAGLLAKAISEATGIPYLVTEHSTGYFAGNLSVWQLKTARTVFNSSAANVAVSKSLANLMEDQYQYRAPWNVVPNIVSEQFFKEPLLLKEGERSTKFVHVALLNPIKRQQVLIDAVRLCSEAGRSDLKLTIVGDGPERSALEKSVLSSGLEKQVFFSGMQPRAAISTVLADHDVFLLSSDYETFGVVVAEALAVGLPCITTDCGGPVDIVVTGDGVIVPRGDAHAMAKAMMEFADRPRDKRDRLERRQRCANRFGEHGVCNSLIDHYRAITGVQVV
jgi:glycosyltransferase involved in cell wall biosynthesis